MEKLNDTGFEISSSPNYDSFMGMTEKLNTLFNELCKENDTLREFIGENGLDNEFRLYQKDLSEINPEDITEEKLPEKEQQNLKKNTLEVNVEQQVEGEQQENKQPKNTLQNDRKNARKGGR